MEKEKNINGRKNEKGKEYYNNGKLIFEGEYQDDKQYEEGKEYDLKGKLIFEREYLYNYKIKGREYYKDKLE